MKLRHHFEFIWILAFLLSSCAPVEEIQPTNPSNTPNSVANNSVANNSVASRTSSPSCKTALNPQKIVHRLNNFEYQQTLQSLFNFVPARVLTFPDDIGSLGFRNIAEASFTNEERLVAYVEAAEELARHLLANPQKLTCQDTTDTCADKIISNLGEKAYRRPLDSQTKLSLIAIFNQNKKSIPSISNSPFWVGVYHVIVVIFSSPQFLYRIEISENKNTTRNLDSYEIASRLSYFLWSSSPDAELLSLAKNNSLLDPTVRAQQLKRMIQDPKIWNLYENFLVGWLDLNVLRTSGFQTDLTTRENMIKEVKHIFDYALKNNQPLRSLVNSNSTYLNGSLASYYGYNSAATLSSFTRVITPSTQARGGLLTSGALMTATSQNYSHPNEIRRGLAALNTFLCTPISDPPTIQRDLPSNIDAANMTRREIAATVRGGSDCSSCHKLMDPLGFGFDHFDVRGKWQTEENGVSIDTSGVFKGKSFSNTAALKQIIGLSHDYHRCASKNIAIYALGRSLTKNEECILDDFVNKSANSKYGLQDVLTDLINSDLFIKHFEGVVE